MIRVDGRVGLMRQFLGSERKPTTIREFLLAYAEPAVAAAARALDKAERWMRDHPGEDGQMRYAEALARWGEAGGYEAEVLFDTCTHAAFGQGYPECATRRIETLSGGERKRLAIEVILRSPFGRCCSTSRTTRSTSRASAGSRSRSPRARRRSCSSATTGPCSNARPTAS